jgi:hypothetical protein
VNPEGVYYMWGKLKRDEWTDMVILTLDQMNHHCGAGKYLRGSPPPW